MEGIRWQGGTTKDISTSTVGPIVGGHMFETQGSEPSSMERAFLGLFAGGAPLH